MEMVQDPIHTAPSAKPASDTASNRRRGVAAPAVDFEFPCADLPLEAETPCRFLHSASTAATVGYSQNILQADCAEKSTPADASLHSCVPKGSTNNQPIMFFGVDFASLSACEATAQQVNWVTAPSASEKSLTGSCKSGGLSCYGTAGRQSSIINCRERSRPAGQQRGMQHQDLRHTASSCTLCNQQHSSRCTGSCPEQRRTFCCIATQAQAGSQSLRTVCCCAHQDRQHNLQCT